MLNENQLIYIDDEPMNLDLVERSLYKLGYSMIGATSAEQGLQLIAKYKPAVIIMDMHMPEMSGLEATALIKADKSIAHIPVIALTADHREETRRNALASGCAAFMTKPIQRTLLHKIVQELVSQSH